MVREPGAECSALLRGARNEGPRGRRVQWAIGMPTSPMHELV